jgi:hypothetical protein
MYHWPWAGRSQKELCVKLSIEPLVRSKKNDGKNFNATIFLTGSIYRGKNRGDGGTNDF